MEYEKILFSRFIFSFLWTIALNIFPLSLYAILTNFDIVHPLAWLVNSALIIFSIGTWISFIPVHGLVFTLGYILSQEHKKPPTLKGSRFKLLCSFFTKNNILKCFIYVLLGLTLPWVFLKLNNNSLIRQCEDFTQDLCLDEDCVFLVTCGVWIALYYFIRFDVLTEKHLQFPIIRQLRFLQIRSKFPNTFKNCFKSSLMPCFYFLIFFFIYGKQIVSLFDFVFSAHHNSLTLTKISGLLNISLLLQAWLISSIYFSFVESLQLMIQIHYTEHYSFSLMKQPNSNLVLLSTALGEQNLTIIQHLACYDLYNLSTTEKSNRWQVFMLSQPGGHPHTWNAILHESLKLIDKFICEIEEIYKVPEPVKPLSPVPKHLHVRDMTVRHEKMISGPVPLSPTIKIRNLVDHSQKTHIRQHQSAMEKIWIKINSYITIIQKNSIINYIFVSKLDAKIRFMVSNSQPLIWVIQSISELSANALTEDQFGIVLKDLPLIINTLLRLKFSLDKLGNLQKKFQKRDHDLCMKASLKSALRRSLYRIAIAYSDYLTDLPLPSENLKCMQNFVNFKEC